MISLIKLSVLCFVAMTNSVQEKQKSDLKTLEGTWVLVGLEVDGMAVAEEKLAKTEMQIKGNVYTTMVKGKKRVATLELFANKKPKAVDMVPQDGPHKDQVLKGIYRVKDGKLQICRGLAMTQERPTSFETTAGSGLFVVTWQRKGK